MFYSVTCKNPDCGKRFKIRGPLKAGVHKVGCPFCSKKMSVRIKGEPEPKNVNASQPKKVIAPYPRPLAEIERLSQQFASRLEALKAAHDKKQAALKDAYAKRRAALKAEFDRQYSANEANYAGEKAAIEADMKATINFSQQAKARQQSELKRQQAVQPQSAPTKPKVADNSAAETKSMAEKIMTGTDGAKGTCPHCGQMLNVPRQEKAGPKQVRCPKCKGPISISYTMPHKPTVNFVADMPVQPHAMPQAQKMQQPQMHAPQAQKMQPKQERAYLIANHDNNGRRMRFVTDGVGRPVGSLNHQFGEDRVYLNVGNNVIGRHDKDTPSDIGVDGDSLMSRRSVCIEVTHTPMGLRFAFRLLNTKNRVLCNGLDIKDKNPYPITYGANIVLGVTQFTLMREL